ncbi:MAG: type II CAAX endopeptidase family protein [Elusimicrobiota bacterium]
MKTENEGFSSTKLAYIFFIVAFAPSLYPGLFQGLSWLDRVLHAGFAHVSAASLYAAASLFLFFSLFRSSRIGDDPRSEFNFTGWRAQLPLLLTIIAIDLAITWGWVRMATAVKSTDLLDHLGNLSAHDPAPALFLGVALAAFAEEVLLRGLFQGYLQKYFGWKAIFMTSLFFAVVHHGRGLTGLFFVASLPCGFLYYRTKSLTWPAFVHVFHNIFFTVFPPRF